MSPWHIGIVISCVAGFAGVPGCMFGGGNPPVVIKAGDTTPDTTVAIDLQTPIAPGTNVLWCGTIQLAWDELAKMYGGSVRFAKPIPPAASILNRGEVEPSDFDPASIVAILERTAMVYTTKSLMPCWKNFTARSIPNCFRPRGRLVKQGPRR